MDRPETAVLIASPHAGHHHRDAMSQAKKVLAVRGVRIMQEYQVADLDGLPPQGAIWKAGGADIAIAAGGDGTIGAVATHLAGSGLPLGILPLGTSNDFARALNLPLAVVDACQVIADGALVPTDLGMTMPAETAPFALHDIATAAAAPGQPATLPEEASHSRAYFVHALTLGLNVAFAKLATNVAMRHRYGALTYPMAALEALTEYRTIAVRLTFAGLLPYHHGKVHAANPVERQVCNYRALQVAAVNAPIFGGRLHLGIPDVAMNDGILDIIVIEDLNPAELVATVKEIATRDLARRKERTGDTPDEEPAGSDLDECFLPGVRRFKARSVTLETGEPVDATLDGEVRARAPLHLSVARSALQVLAPAPLMATTNATVQRKPEDV
jgi:diacylglycerol kinase (ATP)